MMLSRFSWLSKKWTEHQLQQLYGMLAGKLFSAMQDFLCLAFFCAYRHYSHWAQVTSDDVIQFTCNRCPHLLLSKNNNNTYLGTPALNHGASVISLYGRGLPWKLLPSWDIPFSIRDVDLDIENKWYGYACKERESKTKIQIMNVQYETQNLHKENVLF